MKVSFTTYGCKVNQYETELVRQLFLKSGGFTEAPDADICVINSCTVTAKIDSDILRSIKQMKAAGKKVVLTGCLAGRSGIDEFRKNADWIIPNEKKFTLSSYPVEITGVSADSRESVLDGFTGKNKAFVKIEDGCDRFCSYCTVPLVRGSVIKSRDEGEIAKEVMNLTSAGFKEIILTGVNLGLYGREKRAPAALFNLLKKLIKITGKSRLRLSSIGPVDLHEDVINLASDNPEKICPHFHLSLQSGDDAVLKRMNRNYNTAAYAEKAGYIIKKMGSAGITTDVIAGFPGETAQEFGNTVEFIGGMPLTRLHVFPYSDRPGTKATAMKDKVNDRVKKERVKALLKLGVKKEREFAEKNTGLKRTVLVEEGAKNGKLCGYTENYIRVSLKETPQVRKKINNLAEVVIKKVDGKEIIAEVV